MSPILAFLLLIPFWSIGQNDIVLNINHKLGGSDFALNTGAVNNLGHDFNVSRLQYYISEISILHDGGAETLIEDLWVLADASKPAAIELGNHNITQVEGIRFHIGVDSAHNHLDPASWPAFHPLAPQFPSMHWGWVSGYRFAAFEGKGGSNYNQLFELHPLGNDYYFQTEVLLSATAENNQIVINLDADYARGLENISVNGGVIVHGDYGAAITALENFRDYVFSPSATPTSTIDRTEAGRFSVFPNPSTAGTATLRLAAAGTSTFDVCITDMLGRRVAFLHSVNGEALLRVDQPGLYLVSLMEGGQVIGTQKWKVE